MSRADRIWSDLWGLASMIYILAFFVPPLALLLNGQLFAAIFNVVLIVPCLFFGLIFPCCCWCRRRTPSSRSTTRARTASTARSSRRSASTARRRAGALTLKPARGRRPRCCGRRDRARTPRNSWRDTAAAGPARRCPCRRRRAPPGGTRRRWRGPSPGSRHAAASSSPPSPPIQKSGLPPAPKPAAGARASVCSGADLHHQHVAERRQRLRVERLRLGVIGNRKPDVIDHGQFSRVAVLSRCGFRGC